MSEPNQSPVQGVVWTCGSCPLFLKPQPNDIRGICRKELRSHAIPKEAQRVVAPGQPLAISFDYNSFYSPTAEHMLACSFHPAMAAMMQELTADVIRRKRLADEGHRQHEAYVAANGAETTDDSLAAHIVGDC